MYDITISSVILRSRKESGLNDLTQSHIDMATGQGGTGLARTGWDRAREDRVGQG